MAAPGFVASATVSALSVTAVKGTRLRVVPQISLTRSGASGDRRFFVVDERDRMVNSKILGGLQTVVSDYHEASGRLSLRFYDGLEVAGLVQQAEPITARFFSMTAEGRVIDGPWSEALSSRLGHELRLVEAVPSNGRGSAVDRGDHGAATLISVASVRRLAAEAGVESLDARRFRMLIEVDGIEAHAEDRWVGSEVRIGEALLRLEGNVGRCLITSRDPDTGVVDLPTLELLGAYRGSEDATEPLPFGVYGSVLEEGIVRVGDAVIGT